MLFLPQKPSLFHVSQNERVKGTSSLSSYTQYILYIEPRLYFSQLPNHLIGLIRTTWKGRRESFRGWISVSVERAQDVTLGEFYLHSIGFS